MTQIPKLKKQQLNNQNYTNQNSHSKNSVPASLSGNTTCRKCTDVLEETIKTLINFGEITALLADIGYLVKPLSND